jgi:hypothetical protein
MIHDIKLMSSQKGSICQVDEFPKRVYLIDSAVIYRCGKDVEAINVLLWMIIVYNFLCYQSSKRVQKCREYNGGTDPVAKCKLSLGLFTDFLTCINS